MIRRASIPGARPPPPRRRPLPSSCTASSRARRSRGQAKRAPRRRRRRATRSASCSGPSRTAASPGPRRRRTPAPGPPRPAVLIERLDPAQVVEPERHQSGLLLPAPAAAASAGRSPSSMCPCTVSHEPGHRPPGGPAQHQALAARAPIPRRTYTSTSETRTEVMAPSARTRPAARCLPAGISRDGTAPRSPFPAPPGWERLRRIRRCPAPPLGERSLGW